MSKSDYQELIAEYKDQIRILKQEVAELQDAGKSKDSANKRSLQKLEHITDDLEKKNNREENSWAILILCLVFGCSSVLSSHLVRNIGYPLFSIDILFIMNSLKHNI